MNFSSFNNFTNTFVFDSKKKGPTITIFGGIHGDEIVGIKVIDSLLNKIKNNQIELLKGKIIFAYGNEEAIKLGTRKIKYNLNRLFKTKYFNSSSSDYEVNRVKELQAILSESDILLDIHSTSSNSEPFIFAEKFKNELDIVKIIGPNKIIVGWEKISGDLLSGDSNGYMHKLGKQAFTLECGQHNSENAYITGYNISINLLIFFGLIKHNYIHSESNNINLIEMYKIQTTKSGEFKFFKQLRNFDIMKKGDLIGTDGEEKLFSQEDFVILLPNYGKLEIGEDIFYYGTKLLN